MRRRRSCRAAAETFAGMEWVAPICTYKWMLLTALVLYTRDPGRCPLREPASFRAAAGGVCCRTVWMSEAAADGWLVRGLVCALPFAAASWFAFDDGD